MATQPNAALSWKQEVNQRLAAHRNRKEGGAAEADSAAEEHPAVNTRATQAAARVAARYAQAPSYSQMLAEEARAAVRAAEAASQAARKAQAAAESVLAGLETVSQEAPCEEADGQQSSFFDPFFEIERPVMAAGRQVDPQTIEIRWDPDMPVRRHEPAAARATRRAERFDAEVESWREPAANYGEPETVEPAQPIHANLIEFPRELVAARKARPRIAEGPLAQESDQGGQLSIFEVDAGTISIQPDATDTAAEIHASGWSRIRLDAEPRTQAALAHDSAEATARAPLQPAPFGLRVMAALVDFGLVGALAIGLALAITSNIDTQISARSMELAGGFGVLTIAALYQAFFFSLAESTPGMRYAGIRLSTFDDRIPSRAQLRRRLYALILSLLPMGLGLLWAIFDEDHLSWHDRISRTYQR
jgi:uncharacterized RDD family membrane protein YckC